MIETKAGAEVNLVDVGRLLGQIPNPEHRNENMAGPELPLSICKPGLFAVEHGLLSLLPGFVACRLFCFHRRLGAMLRLGRFLHAFDRGFLAGFRILHLDFTGFDRGGPIAADARGVR